MYVCGHVYLHVYVRKFLCMLARNSLCPLSVISRCVNKNVFHLVCEYASYHMITNDVVQSSL